MQSQSTPIPPGLCQCGCGQATKPALATDPRRGTIKGAPQRFIRGHQRRSSPSEYIVDPETGCWIWQRSLDGKGYGQRWNGRKNVRAHVWYYEQVRGPVPDGLKLDHVCHTLDLTCLGGPCFHRRCVNPGHLEPVTLRVNLRRGRRTKLSEETVREIRLLAPSATKADLASRFGVSMSTVGGIVQNQHWVDASYTRSEKRAKLTTADVLEIRRLADQLTIQALAKQFVVSWHTIRSVISRQSWRHV